MISGLYAAANGMISMEDRQAIIANNIANAATPGFRRQEGVLKGFYEVLLGELGSAQRYDQSTSPGGGITLDQSFTDLSGGPIGTTGNPLDVAIAGPGYFVVETPAGQRYTRNGRFTVDAEGELATSDGYKVLSGGGPIAVDGKLQIDENGGISVEGAVVGSLDLVEFQNPQLLQREGNNLYGVAPGTTNESAPATNTSVVPASIENSNVQIPIEITNMILGMRAYGANQKVINAIDESMSRLIDQVATPS